jgi:hypothetical protein
MKVSWVGIYDRGNMQLERIHFRALVPIDLCYYAVIDSQSVGNPITAVQAHNKGCYWFTSFRVEAGQNVVLYSRSGAMTTENRADGSTFHFFFRGLTAPLYQDASKCAVLLEVNDWISTQ